LGPVFAATILSAGQNAVGGQAEPMSARQSSVLRRRV